MMAGDGLLVRVRPPQGRLAVPQAIALAEAARLHGNGLIDLTNRAALQLRGVTEQSHGPLLRQLVALRSEEHTSELQSLMRISYAVFCLKKKNTTHVLVTDIINE